MAIKIPQFVYWIALILLGVIMMAMDNKEGFNLDMITVPIKDFIRWLNRQ